MALRIAGFNNVLDYDGSIYEWSRTPSLDLITGVDGAKLPKAGID